MVEPSPHTTTIGRRLLLAGIWGLLISLVGFGAAFGYGSMNLPPQGRSPETNGIRGLDRDIMAIQVWFVGLMAGAVFGGVCCFVPRVRASWLSVVGGLAVAGFVTTAIQAVLGWERFIGWTWLGTCLAACCFVCLLTFFLVGRTETGKAG